MKESDPICTQVDSQVLDEVEQTCFQILYRQRLRYNNRWYSSTLFTASIRGLRWAGLILSLFGAVLCAYYLIYPSACPKWFYAEAYLLFFLATGVFFYFMPRLDSRIVQRLKNAGRSSCKRAARLYVSKARKQLPYTAEYIVSGKTISYFRTTDKKRTQLWSRPLRGYGVVGEQATLLFRKPTSIQATMLILHADKDEFESVLKELALAYETMSTCEQMATK